MFHQNCLLWPVCLGWPCTAWLKGPELHKPFCHDKSMTCEGDCHGEGTCIIQWSAEPCVVEPPKIDRSKSTVMQKEIANHSRLFALSTPLPVWKCKKIWYWKMRFRGRKVLSMLLGKTGGQPLIAPERMKWLGQSINGALFWMYLVVKVNSKAIKNNIA